MLRSSLPIILSVRIRSLVTFRSQHTYSLAATSNISNSLEPKHPLRVQSMQCGTNSCCFSKEELKERLTLTQYQVTQERDTERAFSGKYCRHEEKGTYSCIVCGEPIFSSEAKFPSPCGWPAFSDVIDPSKVKLTPDLSHDMMRTEVSCAKCNAHMGHLFDDGPKPTGKRYCINSAALDFQKASEGDGTNAA